MFVGLGFLVAGFITMSLDSADYGLGFLGLTLGPILLAIGFVVQFFAIMAKSGNVTPNRDVTTASTSTSGPVPPAAPAAPVTPTYQRR
jgi:hypothetical protein